MTQEVNPVGDFNVILEFSVNEINTLLNVLNTPNAVPTTMFVAFIDKIQKQAGPQVKQAQESLAAVAKAQDESKTAS